MAQGFTPCAIALPRDLLCGILPPVAYHPRHEECPFNAMNAPPINLLNWLLALLPIVMVLVLMVGRRWGGAQAGPVGWLTALLVAGTAFGTGVDVVIYSQLKSILLSLYVLYIIWPALALYHVVNQAGALEVIGAGVSQLTRDRTMQLLILGWVFASFLQGVTGFGVPAAVVAPLLISLEFTPRVAVISATVGHSWAVTFGSISSSFFALMAVTGLPGRELAPWSAIFLAAAGFACGLAVVHVAEGWRGWGHALPVVVIVGSAMGSVQYLLSTNGLWSVAAFLAGFTGLGVAALMARLPAYRGPDLDGDPPSQPMSLVMALSAYLVLLTIVVSAELIGSIHRVLNVVKLRVLFPETVTRFGWTVPAGPGRSISLFGHAGALIIYTCIIAYAIYARAGHYQPGAWCRVLRSTARGATRSSIGILSMVGMALIMDNSGMTYLLAQGLSRTMGSTFPAVAPFIGALGAFMTGSNTNSNVVFAPLQLNTARLLGINALVILGAQTAGGALGGMFAPAKVIVGCSTAGLAGREGEVMRSLLAYGLSIVALIGVLAYLAAI
ncbi:MAG TPA: L-lactate permease [Anaerolineae bacterium]|nr:L-lactate permease [Anaerolineae bacterium]